MRQHTKRILAYPTLLMVSAILTLGTPALAGKPSDHGQGKVERQDSEKKHKVNKQHHDDHDQGAKKKKADKQKKGKHAFADRERQEVHHYYAEQFRSGNCPPGLAKKENGCQPPGLAKKWVVGRPLPPDVTIYELPAVVIDMIGPPPLGQRYVRVANDILMIAEGTSMVMDAIQDLGK